MIVVVILSMSEDFFILIVFYHMYDLNKYLFYLN